jgi:hypothetical protein
MSNQFLKLRRSSVPGKIPTTSSLEFGEIALNTYDGLAFIKKSGSNGEEIIAIGATATISGSQYFIPVFSGSGVTESTIFQSGSFIGFPNATAPLDPTNPDLLFISASGIETYNLISAHSDYDSYVQLNVQNFSSGFTASADIVASNNTATETTNFINMGINGDGYAITDGIGSQNDAYLFSTGENLLIGNASEGKKVIIFNGTGSALDNARLFIVPEGTVGINSQDPNPGNPESLLVEPIAGASNPSQFSNLIIGKGTVHENYLQLNIINLGTGSLASSDIVATNDIGDETSYYIDMGVNSSGYNTPNAVGTGSDAYLYSTARHLHIGNVSNYPIQFFAGGLDSDANRKFELYPDNRHTMTGSLNASEGFTGSLYGTASWALNTLTSSYVANAVSASYAATASLAINAITASYVVLSQTASYVLNAVSSSYAATASWAINALTASSADSFTVRGGLTGSDAVFTGTITAQRLNVQYITASTELVTGSTKFGTQLTDTHQFTGSVSITGSLTVNGPLNATASWANNAVTASYVQIAQTASFVATASWAQNSITASYVVLSQTASYVQLAQTASYVQNAQTASYVLNAVSSSFSTNSATASFVATASWARNAITASYVLNAVSSSFASNAATASFVTLAQTASYVLNAVSASFATNAATASFVTTAQTASFVTASNVWGPFGSNSIISSSYALTASFALNAGGASVTNRIATGSVTASVNVVSASFQVTSASIVLMALDRAGALTASRAFLSSSNGTLSGSTLTVYGSGSAQPVFTVQGSQGELFSVSDSLSGSLFSVNDISGLPVIEAFSDNRVLIGSYQAPALFTTVRTTSTAGANVIYSVPTASYDAVFFEYSLRSGSNARAGQIMSIWSGSDTNWTETVTADFGNTTGVTFRTIITGSSLALTGSFPSASWTMKTIIRGI